MRNELRVNRNFCGWHDGFFSAFAQYVFRSAV